MVQTVATFCSAFDERKGMADRLHAAITAESPSVLIAPLTPYLKFSFRTQFRLNCIGKTRTFYLTLSLSLKP